MKGAPCVATPGTRPRYAVVGDLYDILADSAQTGGQYALLHALVPPQGGTPPHTHSREDEAFYVLEGELVVTIDGQRHVARAGSFVHAPRGIPHYFRNEGATPTVMLVWVVPGGFEAFFREVGEVCSPGTTAPPAVTDAHVARVLDRAPHYGVQIHLPA